MIFNFFGKRERKPTPPWLAWLMIGVVLYAMLASQQKHSDVRHAIEEGKENLNTQLSPLASLGDKWMPNTYTPLRVEDRAGGTGAPAICGQQATIAYRAWLTEDHALDDEATAEKPLSFTLGGGKVLPALERGVIGMQKGGKRTLYATPEMSYRAPGFVRDDVPVDATIKFDVELITLTPDLSALADTTYRIIDTVPNTGIPVVCGNKIRAHVVFWSVEGKKLFSTVDNKTPIEFTPGLSEVFLGLEHGVVGMMPGGRRMLIVPPAFQQTLSGKAPAIAFPFPKGETVLVEIEALP